MNWKIKVQEEYVDLPRCHLWLAGEPVPEPKTPDSWSSSLSHENMFVKPSEKYKVHSGCIIRILHWVQIIWIPNLKEPKLNVRVNLFSKPCPNANKKMNEQHCLRITEHFRTLILILRNAMKKHQAAASDISFLYFLPKCMWCHRNLR